MLEHFPSPYTVKFTTKTSAPADAQAVSVVASVILDKLIGVDVTKKVSVSRNAKLQPAATTPAKQNGQGTQQGQQAYVGHDDKPGQVWLQSQKHQQSRHQQQSREQHQSSKQQQSRDQAQNGQHQDRQSQQARAGKHEPSVTAQQPLSSRLNQLLSSKPGPMAGSAATTAAATRRSSAQRTSDQRRQPVRQSHATSSLAQDSYITASAQPDACRNLGAGRSGQASAAYSSAAFDTSTDAVPDICHSTNCNELGISGHSECYTSDAERHHQTWASFQSRSSLAKDTQAAADAQGHSCAEMAAGGSLPAVSGKPGKAKRRLLNNVFTLPYDAPAKPRQELAQSSDRSMGQSGSDKAKKVPAQV